MFAFSQRVNYLNMKSLILLWCIFLVMASQPRFISTRRTRSVSFFCWCQVYPKSLSWQRGRFFRFNK